MARFYPKHPNKVRAALDIIVLWWTSRFFAFLIAAFLSFPKRHRMSHDNGISGLGRLKIVDNPEFPEHDFFKAGAEFPVRIRHATATFLDDAVNDIRSISIKFSHHYFKSPFDLELNTGAISLFWNAASFLKFAKLRDEKHAVCYVEYIRKYPEGATGAIESLRKAPDSFTHLKYYCQTPFLFVGKDGVTRYAKYRVVPAVEVPEPGLQVNSCEFELSNQRVAPHEQRGRNYLKYEYEQRVAKTEAKYMLQIQLIRADESDNKEVFNNMLIWDDILYPWMDLASFQINTTTDWKESILSTFSVNNMPKSLGVIPAVSVYDYNSLNYMRAHSEIARKARLLSIKLFGMVPPIPDNDYRNAEDWGK